MVTPAPSDIVTRPDRQNLFNDVQVVVTELRLTLLDDLCEIVGRADGRRDIERAGNAGKLRQATAPHQAPTLTHR